MTRHLILAVLVLPGAAACTQKSNAFAPPPPPKVTVAHPVQKDVTHYLEYSGTIEAHQIVDAPRTMIESG